MRRRELSEVMLDLMDNHGLYKEVANLLTKYDLKPWTIYMGSTWDTMYIIPSQEELEVDESGGMVFIKKPWPEGYIEEVLELVETVENLLE